MIYINVIESRKSNYIEEFLMSLEATLVPNSYKISVTKELEFREKTLNKIIANNGNKDLLIFADDVILTNGWYENLMKRKNSGDILGFCNLYPGTSNIQDTGYDLVSIDGRIVTEARNRGFDLDNLELAPFSECDSIMGCAMFIKKEVISILKSFSLRGNNRWGEIIFCHQARRRGFKVGVIDHFLYHHGKSTKANKKIKYSSESYQIEKKKWDTISKTFFFFIFIKKEIKTELSEGLKVLLKKYKKIILFGAGTISEVFLKEDELNINAIISGLPEEHNKIFNNKKIVYYKKFKIESYSLILITIIDRYIEISNLLKDYFGTLNIVKIKKINRKNKYIYDIDSNSPLNLKIEKNVI